MKKIGLLIYSCTMVRTFSMHTFYTKDSTKYYTLSYVELPGRHRGLKLSIDTIGIASTKKKNLGLAPSQI